MAEFIKFDSIAPIEYYRANNTETSLTQDVWNVNTSKRHAFKIYSDVDVLDEHEEKIFVPAVNKETSSISQFSTQLNTAFRDTKVTIDEFGNEIVVLTLDSRVVTIILDQSGSMTWNDSNGYRHTLAKEIIEKIDENYPGNVIYNIIHYGGKIIDLLFFGIKSSGLEDANSLNGLNELLLADPDANFVGVRVIRNTDHYPNSVVDGEEVADGILSRVLDTGLLEDETYYYTVFTYDSSLKFSQGVNIRVSPRDRVVPRGISVFKSWVPFIETSVGEMLKGSGIVRDGNVVGSWHMDESRGSYAWDFSESGINLKFEKEPEWVPPSLTSSGVSAVRLDGNNFGISTSGIDTSDIALTPGQSMTFMVWVFPYDIGDINNNILLSRQDIPGVNEVLGDVNWNIEILSDGRIKIDVPLPSDETPGADASIYSAISSLNESLVSTNTWNHIAIVVDDSISFDPSFQGEGNVNFYINGIYAGFDEISFDRNVASNSLMSLVLGGTSLGSGGSAIEKFYGKISDISIHNVARTSDYINEQISKFDVKDDDGNVIREEYAGTVGDNGDRLVVLQYEVPHDFDFSGGSIRIVRKEKNPPSWEEDGITVHENNSVVPGIVYVTDQDDFVHKEKYYYRIFSRNIQGNYSFLTDSSLLKFVTPESADTFFPDVVPDLVACSEPDIGQLITPGNKKIYLRWKNNSELDSRILRTKIFYSPNTYPVVGDKGPSDGEMIFSGLVTETQFVHRGIENNKEAFYSIVNVDKYGRASTVLISRSVPSGDSDEGTIPLPEVTNVHYELYSRDSVTLAWDQSVERNPGVVDAFFDETILVYASIIDQFGVAISDESQVDLDIEATVSRASSVDDVFASGINASFSDDDAFEFLISKDVSGIMRGTLNMSTDQSIVSQIESASFNIRIKSFIPDPDGGENLFEYISDSLVVNFTNPWQIELTNRDNLRIYERCYFPETVITDEGKEQKVLRVSQESFHGIHIRKLSPFVARAKLTFKGEPVLAGAVTASIWDAEAELCTCATSKNDMCEYKGRKIRPSETVSLANITLPVIRGFEDVLDADGNTIQKAISYVDIPLFSPNLPQSALLFVKGTHASFSSIKDLYIVFQNILQVDINANAPKVNGQDVVEQQASVFLINPNHPEDKSLRTVPDDLTVMQWEILPVDSETTRTLYSVDNVAIPNGIFSYVRNGIARNIFFGPVAGEADPIEETHEIRATLVSNGLTSTARQFVSLEYNPKTLPEFGARFLMETEYHYKRARNNRIWTDGEDYVKLIISRDPRTSTTKHATLFRSCAAEEDAPLLELNPAGQTVHLKSSIDEIEFVYNEVTEDIDPYSGNKFLSLSSNSIISPKEVFLPLNSEEVSDTTEVFIRVNKFTPDASGWKVDPECDETKKVNLDCLELNFCDLPGGDIFVDGVTTLFVNDEPFELSGGGDVEVGAPPCPITFKEPLRLSIVFMKVDGIEVDSFLEDDAETSILTPSSAIDIRVEVLFAGDPVPDGTFVFLVISNSSEGTPVFIGSSNIVTTFTEDGKSYADVRIIARRNPTETITETARIITRYNKIGDTARERVEKFYLKLDHQDFTIPTGDITVADPSIVPPAESFSIFSDTVYRYDIEKNEWSQMQSISKGRGNMFGGLIGNSLYVMGGLLNNSFGISSATEEYFLDEDVWGLVAPMPTPRFGGSSVVINNDIYTIGGIKINDDNEIIEVSNVLEVYHANTNTWEVLSPMPFVNESTVDEISYGVAFGTAQRVSINGSEYIYVLSGANEVDISRGSARISRYNDRILRYDIENNIWELSRVLYVSEIDAYKRISPLSLVDVDRIIVFNGALNNERDYDFHVDFYKIAFRADVDDFEFKIGGIDFSEMPISKFQSSIVSTSGNPSIASDFYIVGGSSSSNEHMDIVEIINNASSPLTYIGSQDDDPSTNTSPLPIGKNGVFSAIGNIGTKSYVFSVGGFTSGTDPDQIVIDFDI